MLIALTSTTSRRDAEYVGELRRELPGGSPSCTFHFEPADIVTQILNFGVPAPIDIQVSGLKPDATYAAAQTIAAPAAAGAGGGGRADPPGDRRAAAAHRGRPARGAEVGLTQRDVANNVLVAPPTASR